MVVGVGGWWWALADDGGGGGCWQVVVVGVAGARKPRLDRILSRLDWIQSNLEY